MPAQQTEHLRFSEAPGRAAQDTWMVLAAGKRCRFLPGLPLRLFCPANQRDKLVCSLVLMTQSAASSKATEVEH